jgi:E3 ubiquitin-protein ligase synoviolin
MDSLTREAIDERLRVLEGVSGAIFRCIDDLLRMRSVLPASAPATVTSQPNTSSLPRNQEMPSNTGIAETPSVATADEELSHNKPQVVDDVASNDAGTDENNSSGHPIVADSSTTKLHEESTPI